MVAAGNTKQAISTWAFLRTSVPVKRRHIGVLFLLSAVSNLLMLVGPIFMLQVYDRVLGSRSVPTLVALTLLVVALFGFYALVEVIRARMTVRIAMLIHQDLALGAFRSTILAGRSQHGEPLRDLDTIRGFVAGPGPVSLMDLPWLPLYMCLVVMLHPLLGLVASGGALVMAALLILNESMSRAPSRQTSAAMVERQVIVDDSKANMDVVVAMGMLPAIGARFLDASSRLVDSQRVAADHAAFFSSTGKSFRLLLQSGVLATGAYLVIVGQLSPGLMLASSVITARALAPIESLIGNWKGFVGTRQALKRLSERVYATPQIAQRTRLPRPSRSLTVTNLASGPGIGKAPIVADFSFSIEAGEGLGIIGSSGSGKSTIARAIVGIWPALRGDVRFDGSDRAHFDPEVLGSAIGYLPQDVELFDGSVADNISRFQRPGSSAPILAAAKASGTHQLISDLADGFDTRIGARGAALSAGQRQRIGLARALYGEPFLLVLDEPNANLDQEGEQALIQALNSAKSRGAIVLLIAHRPSAIIVTEKLLAVAGGRQAAFGDRDEVLRRVTKPSPPVAQMMRSHG